MVVEHSPAVVIGSGLAGMTAALSLGPMATLVITKTEEVVGGSTPWAQGGVAFPRDAEDEPLHVQDTLVSGAGHSDPPAAQRLVTKAAEARRWLESQGVVFDRDSTGAYQYGREGAHSSRRILHVGADGTGSGLAHVLAQQLSQAAHITIRTRTLALCLVPGGLLTWQEGRGFVLIHSSRIILAGGGLGQLFAATTAPAEATGDTIALAMEAGAPVSDLEMVQYHPTALATRKPGAPNLSLLTEALRGEGALLVTAQDPQETGLQPLDTGHPMGSLGPRDVLSRAIFHRQSAGFPVWLDARRIPDTARKFPTVTRLCQERGLDPTQDLLPVVPAVHYTMGGVVADLDGRTGLAGVWAVGETSRTGVHGANRLASNSLLECVVWGRAAAANASASPDRTPCPGNQDHLRSITESWETSTFPIEAVALDLRSKIQAVMGQAAGPVRTAAGLNQGLLDLEALQRTWDQAALTGQRLSDLTRAQCRAILETRNLLLLGPEVLRQAIARKSSLGAHHRGDDPCPIPR